MPGKRKECSRICRSGDRTGWPGSQPGRDKAIAMPATHLLPSRETYAVRPLAVRLLP
jgi:hypothetical protein